ncbi:MAG: rhodanese-like domain-containing protein [Acidimicrobiaceae bacterium]|mgnify:CR=1 FL=1|nr:rhodanese-like domain-containing protein [Ilumatobacter sp.]MCB9379900.1 rhodanese-like domain-containing protein [Acidimicrobiaceae bacterium]MCO5331045.1 rhodanese-like domain-containing protein [Ilumatobacteraceae bacterium]
MSIHEITAAELEELLAAGVRLIDVRETDEYTAGHVPGAVHVALGTVSQHVDAFRGDGPAYVICRSGARSMRACEYLAQEGVEAVNIAGGTLDWVAGGRPVVTGAEPT